MRQHKNEIKIVLIVSLSILFVALGCTKSKTVMVEKSPPKYSPPPPAKKGPPPWAPAHGYRAKHRYYYYPSSHVYYDTGRKLYFYFEGGDHVTLEMDTDKPYEFHSHVVKKYPPGQMKKKEKAKGKKEA